MNKVKCLMFLGWVVFGVDVSAFDKDDSVMIWTVDNKEVLVEKRELAHMYRQSLEQDLEGLDHHVNPDGSVVFLNPTLAFGKDSRRYPPSLIPKSGVGQTIYDLAAGFCRYLLFDRATTNVHFETASSSKKRFLNISTSGAATGIVPGSVTERTPNWEGGWDKDRYYAMYLTHVTCAYDAPDPREEPEGKRDRFSQNDVR